jgi:benzoyl-CoA reductase/2-hydroxyglutaryl-CoA dehydratase subunit BcrC/BadD/HgdB
MTTVIYTSPFVAPEWIAAHGLMPKRLLPTTAIRASHSSAGVCPFARACLDTTEAEHASAVIYTTTCDQLRRAADSLAARTEIPIFLMNVPATRQTDTARELYRSELKRLGRFLVRLGGRAPSDSGLVEVMHTYAATRHAIMERRPHLTSRQFHTALSELSDNGPAPAPDPGSAGSLVWTKELFRELAGKGVRAPTSQAIPLALVGGHLMASHGELFDVIEAAWGAVVLDATADGERAFPMAWGKKPFIAESGDNRGTRPCGGETAEMGLGDDPLVALADAYFEGIPDASRRPNTLLYTWLRRCLSERAVRGIVLAHYVWCDLWHAEAERLKSAMGLPVLKLSLGDEKCITGQTINRVQSFMEMLR